MIDSTDEVRPRSQHPCRTDTPEVEIPTGFLIRPRKDNGSSLDCDWAFRHTRTDNDRAQQSVMPAQRPDLDVQYSI
jgi:hypothetical protein